MQWRGMCISMMRLTGLLLSKLVFLSLLFYKLHYCLIEMMMINQYWADEAFNTFDILFWYWPDTTPFGIEVRPDDTDCVTLFICLLSVLFDIRLKCCLWNSFLLLLIYWHSVVMPCLILTIPFMADLIPVILIYLLNIHYRW